MMDAGLEQSMCDEDFRLSSQEEKLAYRFIRRNHYSPAAIWVLEQMQSRFDEDELRSLLSGFGGRSKNAQILSDISLRLRNADKVEPGNPYVDVPVIEYSGRKENLSGYIGYARYTAIGFWRSDSEPSCRDMTKFGELYRAGMINDEGKELTVEEIGAPNLLASAFIFATENRFPVNVEAIGPCEVFVIGKERFLEFMRLHPLMMQNFLKDISDRSVFLSRKLNEFALLNLKTRLLKYLETHSVIHNQQEVAQKLGVTRPSLARALSELVNEGKIKK
jgi:DNA-binding phage protein